MTGKQLASLVALVTAFSTLGVTAGLADALSTSPLHHEVWFVSPARQSAGDAETTRPDDGSRVVESIRAALAVARDGDTIRVRPGVYRESNLTVDRSVTIIGEDYPTIDGEEKAQIISVTADSARIEGLEVMNVGVSHMEDRAAIKLIDVTGVVVSNNRIINGFFGIYLENSGGCVVSDNRIAAEQSRETTSGNGIHLWYCRDATIEGNHVTGHRDGIYMEFVEDSSIRNNVCENNLRYGLHFMFSNGDIYKENVFHDNGAGVAVMFSEHVTMLNNHFEDNWGSASYGLLLKDIRDSVIHGNRFFRNTIGVYSEGSLRLDCSANEFRENGYAMKIMASSYDNVISGNNFLGNTFDISTNSRQNFNTFEGNYWSRYQGYDLDRDGIGDIPHRPVHLFSLLVEREPAGLILLRSFFIDLIDAAERVMPVYTPPTLLDKQPQMNPLLLSNDMTAHAVGGTQ